MTDQPFVDYYETLQLSPNANSETIERVHRLLARRYHPDNRDTGDVEKFAELQQAFAVLSNVSARAAYDVSYEENRAITWKVFRQESAGDHRANDRRLFQGVLSLLYVARRRDPQQGGMGTITLERMLACPQQHLEFPLWYLKQRGWIERLENGYFAITVDGIDKLNRDDLSLPADRLLADGSADQEKDTSVQAGAQPQLPLLKFAATGS